MNVAERRASLINSKFVVTYSKLFQGLSPAQLDIHGGHDHFWSQLLLLPVDRRFLESQLRQFTKEECLGSLKPILSDLFASCLTHVRTANHQDARKSNALGTLLILVRCILMKTLSGWEVMEILGGGVNESDKVFMEFTATIDTLIADETAPALIRHQLVQLALIFLCGVGSLSPGAYFLRRDLFPSIIAFIKSLDTEQYSFEGVLLLSCLANYHKSDAAKLNPYLLRIRDTTDKDLMRKICWASNFAIDASSKAYQAISDDSLPTLTKTIGSMIASLRPDRALSSTPADRQLFKNQPIEACVILLPILEFIRTNPIFPSIYLEPISLYPDEVKAPSRLPPLPFTVLTLSSYLLTHASSSSTPRALAYANLSLNILMALAENNEVMGVLCQPTPLQIRICRQRLPLLPQCTTPYAPICALLDCCILWLRHNLHKRFEVSSYTTCVWVCRRVIWFLQKDHKRLEYHWRELWAAILGLLDFLSNKLDVLISTGGVEQLVREAINLLDLALSTAEIYLPRPRYVHEFIYELVRSSSILKKSASVLQKLALPQLATRTAGHPSEVLGNIFTVIDFYEEKLAQAGANSANSAMRVVAKIIDADGLYNSKEYSSKIEEPPKRSSDVLSFARYAYIDGLALMP